MVQATYNLHLHRFLVVLVLKIEVEIEIKPSIIQDRRLPKEFNNKVKEVFANHRKPSVLIGSIGNIPPKVGAIR